jgi:hypothetical protein
MLDSNTDGLVLAIVGGGWLICAVIACTISEHKGNSGTIGFLAGLFLGPIGVILCAFNHTCDRNIEKQKIRSGEMKKCPNCAELVKVEANICRFCNTAFYDLDTSEAGLKVRPPARTVIRKR